MSEQPPPYSTVQGDVKHGPPQDGSPYPGPQGPSYPPQQAGYPPQQAGYPPQQAGYPPQQAGYPPQQAGYPPQQAGYPPGGYAPVVTQQPATTIVVMTNVQYREVPVNTVCQFCNQQVITHISYNDGTLTWLLCVGLCIVGCDLGCCLIPFCVDGCKDVLHMCPNCNRKLGRYSRI